MMGTDAGLHADQARRHVGNARFHLARRPLLPQRDSTAMIEANNVEQVLAAIDASYGNCGTSCLRHMACSLSLAPLASMNLLAGQEHGRTIPLAEVWEENLLKVR